MDINWAHDIKLNPCVRINKYVDSGFDYHRDASYTESIGVKSNCTLIIYLNDDYESGETTFVATDTVHDGKSIEEELHYSIDSLSIVPKVGTAVIFDQRLIHKGGIAHGTKYVLRCDIMCTGEIIDINAMKDENKVKDLTRKLFRQAQYQELHGLECSTLYEKVYIFTTKTRYFKV